MLSRIVLAAALLLTAYGAAAAELVALDTRSGVEQRLILLGGRSTVPGYGFRVDGRPDLALRCLPVTLTGRQEQQQATRGDQVPDLSSADRAHPACPENG